MRIISKFFIKTSFLIVLLSANIAYSAGDDVKHPKKLKWSFDGITGKFDRQSAQRGYKVYKEVCASCHSMRFISFRNLEELGYSPEQVKAIAAEYEIDFIDDAGDAQTRPRNAADRFPNPYANKAQGAATNGKYPPDLSLMSKARMDGPNYIYSLLTGYDETPPKDLDLGSSYYNPYFPGKLIAMPPQLEDGKVDYDDGTEATKEQMAKDLVNFLQWAAEPEMEMRKSMGIKVLGFLLLLTIFFYFAKLRIWSKVK